jgi:glycosyltransferase involved in cell wall biosynthesis
MRIGYIGNNYPEKRNIINRSDAVSYFNLSWTNIFTYVNRFNFQWRKIFNRNLFRAEYYRYRNIIPIQVDGIHFFNSISFASTSFVVTFETLLPYYWVVKHHYKDLDDLQMLLEDDRVEEALRRLANDRCRALIAMSENTRQNQIQFLEVYPHLKDRIVEKIQVLHPPQVYFGASAQKKEQPDCFELIFVGRAFYRKGGKELIAALEEVRKSINIKLYLISSLDPEAGWFNVNEEGIGDDLEWIAQKTWIEHHRNIPNEEVIKWMQRCHLGFLPTWQDTYGYSVLEMQACGCPVVTTDIRSLSEINSNEWGWVIEVPKNKWSEWDFAQLNGELNGSLWLTERIIQVTKEALSDTALLAAKSKSCLEHIKQHHDPVRHGAQLNDLYHRVFKES